MRIKSLLVAVVCGLLTSVVHAQDAQIPVAVVGLEHGHASGLFYNMSATKNLKLIAVVEKDKTLQAEYTEKSHVDPALYVDSLDAMLAKGKPKALLIYTGPTHHLDRSGLRSMAST